MGLNKLHSLTKFIAYIGGLVVLGLSVLTVASIFGRSLFNSPITGDFELIELGIAIAISCFLPYAQLEKANIIVAFFSEKLPSQLKNKLDAIGNVLLALIFAIFIWRSILGTIDFAAKGDETMVLGIDIFLVCLVLIPNLLLLVICGFATAYTSWTSK